MYLISACIPLCVRHSIKSCDIKTNIIKIQASKKLTLWEYIYMTMNEMGW